MSLQNEQAEFFEILLSDELEIDSVYPKENLTIYRNNINAVLIKTLRDVYPMVMRLVGDDFFTMTAKEYIRQYPSRSSNLHDYGEYFTNFLEYYPAVDDLAYLSEVAKFEWICHRVHFAADHLPLNIKLLEQVSPDQYDRLHFSLHPTCHLMKCDNPMLRIFELCNNNLNDFIDINEGGVNLLIYRPDLNLRFIPLSDSEFTFLSNLHDNFSLAESLEIITLIDNTFNLEEKLPLWINNEVIVDFHLV